MRAGMPKGINLPANARHDPKGVVEPPVISVPLSYMDSAVMALACGIATDLALDLCECRQDCPESHAAVRQPRNIMTSNDDICSSMLRVSQCSPVTSGRLVNHGNIMGCSFIMLHIASIDELKAAAADKIFDCSLDVVALLVPPANKEALQGSFPQAEASHKYGLACALQIPRYYAW